MPMSERIHTETSRGSLAIRTRSMTSAGSECMFTLDVLVAVVVSGGRAAAVEGEVIVVDTQGTYGHGGREAVLTKRCMGNCGPSEHGKRLWLSLLD